jgi:hypothetical protein
VKYEPEPPAPDFEERVLEILTSEQQQLILQPRFRACSGIADSDGG